MSAPLGPWGLAALIAASFAVLALMVVLGAGRNSDPPWEPPETPPAPDQADINRQFADITKHIEE
ncbi:hypothetical protein KCMC57_64930 (plasmid) [Kitasatospora sp. CMC57]|uniref:Secreted protein n=1 Tax=Kitasatospora sp. CMC57 TaxID=3231513 RepID=A0AB33KFA1_9ACTN